MSRCYVCNAYPSDPCHAVDGEMAECPRPSQKTAEPTRECNACDWKGPLSETCMLGAVGPLCPVCRETTEEA
jgi:hypothetical protein